MKKNCCFLRHKLLRILVILILIHSIRTIPVATGVSGLRLDFLANLRGSEQQIKQQVEENKEMKEITNEGLQVLDQMNLDDADGFLSSGSNLPEVSPTIEEQPNSARVDLEEMTPISEDVDQTRSVMDAELMQVRRILKF
jgi:hypothetical protein